MSPRLTAALVALVSLAMSGFGFLVSPVIGIVFAVCLLPAVLVTGLRAGMNARDDRAEANPATSRRTTPKGTGPRGTARKSTGRPKGRSVRR
jgi:hypothetical protein